MPLHGKKSPIAIRKVCYRDDLLTQSTNLSVSHFLRASGIYLFRTPDSSFN